MLTDFLNPSAFAQDLRQHSEKIRELSAVYKQVTAPFGDFAHNTLLASTSAVAGGSTADDSHYVAVENQIASLTGDRDALVAKMRTALNEAAFGSGDGASNQDLKTLIDQGREILNRAEALANNS